MSKRNYLVALFKDKSSQHRHRYASEAAAQADLDKIKSAIDSRSGETIAREGIVLRPDDVSRAYIEVPTSI